MLTDMLDLVEVEVPSLKVLAVKFLATAEHGVEFNIETPRRGETTNALALFVSGWAGMAGRKISNVLIRTSRRTLICTRSPRPDLAGRFGASEAARAGFFAELRVFDLVGTAEAEILAEIEGGDSCVLARLTVQASGRARSDLVGIPPSGLSSLPTLLTINSLGRSGTSLLMGRLLRHPQIGGYAVAPFESRFVQRASLQTMFSITNTRSPYFENNRWYSDSFSSLTWFEDAAAAEELRQILVQTELSRLTNIVLDYRALLQRKTGRQISVICEKTIVGDIARFLAWFWPRSKTVILVRDLRDMLCSFIAFDQKRGFSQFLEGNQPRSGIVFFQTVRLCVPAAKHAQGQLQLDAHRPL